MTDLSLDAAELADLSLIVRSRFIEAADTLAHLQVRGVRPAGASGTWPLMVAENQSDDDQPQHRPTAAAISRMEEVMQGWLLDHVADREQRILLGRWAASLAVPRIVGSFRQFCKKTGRSRSTAERHIDKAFQSIARDLRKTAKSLREPDWSRVVPMLPEWGSEIGMVAERVAERQTAWLADDARPQDRPDMRDFGWADEQSAMRRERAARDKAA